MKAEDVRAHLATLIVGEPTKIPLGQHDTPKAVRNYFLVIAKLEGYKISSRQSEGEVIVTLHSRFEPASKDPSTILNGYYRRNKEQDFNWPALRLTDTEGMVEMMCRIDMTPKPRVGTEYKTPGRKA